MNNQMLKLSQPLSHAKSSLCSTTENWLRLLLYICPSLAKASLSPSGLQLLMAFLHLGHAGCIALQQALQIGVAILVAGQSHERCLNMADLTICNFQVAVQMITNAPPQVIQSDQTSRGLSLPLSSHFVCRLVVLTIHASVNQRLARGWEPTLIWPVIDPKEWNVSLQNIHNMCTT